MSAKTISFAPIMAADQLEEAGICFCRQVLLDREDKAFAKILLTTRPKIVFASYCF